jgi:hypothetical protein
MLRYLLLNRLNCLYDGAIAILNSYLNSFGIVQFTNVFRVLKECPFYDDCDRVGCIASARVSLPIADDG